MLMDQSWVAPASEQYFSNFDVYLNTWEELIKMQILRSHIRTSDSERMGWGLDSAFQPSS